MSRSVPLYPYLHCTVQQSAHMKAVFYTSSLSHLLRVTHSMIDRYALHLSPQLWHHHTQVDYLRSSISVVSLWLLVVTPCNDFTG